MSLTSRGGQALRRPSPARRVLALADDLSGAAETAVALSLSGRILLRPGAAAASAPGAATVLDLDTRHLPANAAARAVRAAVSAADGRVLFKKADSLLRGNLSAETAAYADGAAGVVIAPALPVAGRTVQDGVVHLRGVPLHATQAWRAESRAAPRSVAAALGDVPTAPVPLDVVRGALPVRLRELIASGLHPVCDAETDADLDAIAQAALELGPSVRLLGAGGLAAALGRGLRAGGARPRHRAGHPADPATLPSTGPGSTGIRPLLVVVGTVEPGAIAQIAQLVAAGAHHVALPVAHLGRATQAGLAPVDGTAWLPAGLAPGSVTVVSIADDGTVAPGQGRRLVAGLARAVAEIAHDSDLVLTGGETARRVLDALGVTLLCPVGQIHHGAVHSRTPDGRRVVTRPGSFGEPDSLLRIARALRPCPSTPSTAPALHPPRRNPVNAAPAATPLTEQTGTTGRALPVIAVTMGDGAGIGPEVVVPALLHPDTLRVCRPVVVGDAARLREAARILGVECTVVPVQHPAQAEFTPGRVNVVDLGLLPADLPWGKLSAVAGDAAYHYVRVAADLALRGEVQGICTAPLNKEALHAAGHLYPGHTELLAHFTGVEEVSMMLSTPKVKVIHVTTHIGLIDAVHRIEPGLVERTVRRGHEAMVRAGVAAPVIGVCGINPHAGENGLFGHGEEETKIVPALEVLRADGIDARGPLPADTAFFLASRGDYDLIVAMYHDQGHGPVKVLGIEAGVNLTVGLPVIRTSVDHGTAFDIAGTGRAEAGSMVEALRQAAEMSTAPAAR
ncbi:4-hydroxythreonine-4-phosphate dehydrogenase PdxA [Streptomyces sp. NPDC102462]|uniref:4-hydroxythreonine-4-phosphate dehydrogenase PdxA n=1 Tax=Streptomyces sp. NPDC102462 TaxID=3366178 RepID=UPI0038095486